jgi:hypothetical protein
MAKIQVRRPKRFVFNVSIKLIFQTIYHQKRNTQKGFIYATCVKFAVLARCFIKKYALIFNTLTNFLIHKTSMYLTIM